MLAFRVDIDFAPVYELVVSLFTYKNRPLLHASGRGQQWTKRVTSSLSTELLDLIGRTAQKFCLRKLLVLVRQCPGDRSIEGFIHWFSGLAPGEIFARVEPYTRQVMDRYDAAKVLGFRESTARMLDLWNKQYFSQVDGDILRGLCREAKAARALIDVLPPDVILKRATGIVAYSLPEVEVVLLMPQHHAGDANLMMLGGRLSMFMYPAGNLSLETEEPSCVIERVTRALCSRQRLSILQRLTHQPLTLEQLRTHLRISEPALRREVYALRQAGLISVHVDTDIRYTLCLDGIHDLLDSMKRHLSA